MNVTDAEQEQRELRFVVVDLRPERAPDVDDVDGTWPWRLIGDGASVLDALDCAAEYEQQMKCRHCGRVDNDSSWRVYPIAFPAWNLLTCLDGIDYQKALTPAVDFPWCAARGRFVLIEASCVRCRGGGVMDGRDCHECFGCGTLGSDELAAGIWAEPDESACVWRGDRAFYSVSR